MKKKLSFFLACVFAASSALAAEPGESSRQPGIPHARWEFGANAGYGFSAAPDSRYETDMMGLELEAARYLTKQQALTLSIGVAGASHDRYFLVDDGQHAYFFEDNYDRTDFYVMGGYRAVVVVSNRVALSLGVKAGLDVQSLRTEYGYPSCCPSYWYDDANGKTDTKAGFGYAGYANVSVEVTPQTFVELGYQYRGATTRPHARYADGGEGTPAGAKAADLRWHEVRLGIRHRF